VRTETGGDCYFHTGKFYLEKDKTYTLRYSNKEGNPTAGMVLYNELDASIYTFGDSSKTFFTVPGDGYYYLRVYGPANLVSRGSYSKYYIWIYEGTTDVLNSPYLHKVVNLPEVLQELQGYGLSNPNSGLCNYIDFEKKVYVQNVGSLLFDGFINRISQVTLTSSGLSYAWMDAANLGELRPKQKTIPYVGGDIFYGNALVNSPELGMVLIRVASGYYRIEFYHPDQDLNTVSLWNNWLTENPVEIVYDLEVPIVQDISAYLADDNLIEVSPGGTLKFENNSKSAAFSEIVYQLKGV
jgi:hypothetical protein